MILHGKSDSWNFFIQYTHAIDRHPQVSAVPGTS